MIAVVACALGFVAAGTAGATVYSPAASSGVVDPLAYAEFREDGVRIRTGPSIDDGIAGLGYRGHSVTAHCFTAPQPNSAWYRITNNTTGVRGWVASSMLLVDGSLPGC